MTKQLNAWIYQQFDADLSLPYPGEGYTGWVQRQIPIDPKHTAIVVMHAWDVGTPEQVPAQYRTCEYVPRSTQIIEERFPAFLDKVRKSGFKLIHVGSQSEASLETLPGYIRTKEKWGVDPEPRPCVSSDPVWQQLQQIRSDYGICGKHNEEGLAQARKIRDFAILPRDDEDVVATTHQLFQLCKEQGINHLIYTGFAVNACLTMSPCGMYDMTRRGVLCSIIRELTTAVENKESCRKELHKEYGLWAFSLWGGFVFDQADIENSLL